MDDARSDWAVLDVDCGVVESTTRRFFCATGDERAEFLHGQTSANVQGLVDGQGAAALALSAQGRPLALLALYELGERLWIATTSDQAEATRAALSRYLVADDCDFEDNVEAAAIAVVGPRAPEVLARAGAGSVPGGWGVVAATIAGQPCLVFSRGDLRVPSFDVLLCDREAGPADAEVVSGAIAEAGARPSSVEALEIVRVESGTARFGVDVDDHRLAVEARLEWAIHFAKGCYVGQEVVERAVSRGRINHELALLKLSAPVASGARVDGGGDRDVVTSVVESPRLGSLALAYLPRASAEAGTAVTILDDAGNVEAVVLPWPRARKLEGRKGGSA